jgi:murein DD-endopeptidase MepM/ murein hydrolase activator NlpD
LLIKPVTDWIIASEYEMEEESGDYDILDYIAGKDMTIRPMQYNWDGGGQFPTQTQQHGAGVFDMVRGSQVQRMYYDESYIYLEFDGTQGKNLAYTLQDDPNLAGSIWLDRHQEVGHVTTRNPIVTHFNKNTCVVTHGGFRVQSSIKFIEHHSLITLPNGLVVRDVCEFGWDAGERYFFGKGIGLVMWKNGDDASWLKTLTSDDSSKLDVVEIACYKPRERYYKTKKPVVEPELSFEAWAIKIVRSHESFVQFIDTDPLPAIRRELRAMKLAPQSSEIEGTHNGKRYVLGAGRSIDSETDDTTIIAFPRESGYQTSDMIIVTGKVKPPAPPVDEGFRFSFWPVPSSTTITQAYGANKPYYAKFGLKNGHEGVDIALGFRDEVVAVADGIVVKVGTERIKAQYDQNGRYTGIGHNYGVHVKVEHIEGYETTYAHLDSSSVKVGDIVYAGQVIGLGDSTGNSSGNHLHINLKRSGEYIDPTPYLMSVKETT